jgi:CrcB protein
MRDDDANTPGIPIIPIDPDLDVSGPGELVVTGARRTPRRRHGRARLGVLGVIAIGGMLGATARFAVVEALPTEAGRFPWATFWVNLSGSLVLGFALILLLERFPPTRYIRPFLATGILGAYTTTSTYLVETAVLIQDGHAVTGLTYGIGSLVAGLFLAYAGIVAARLNSQRHHLREAR